SRSDACPDPCTFRDAGCRGCPLPDGRPRHLPQSSRGMLCTAWRIAPRLLLQFPSPQEGFFLTGRRSRPGSGFLPGSAFGLYCYRRVAPAPLRELPAVPVVTVESVARGI